MNYIIHLNKTFAIFCEDERLTPFHVSLYFSLFQYWNMAKFRNPISISRDELMRASKIGSVNTYIRSIKDLHNWNYIKYIPSYNPQKGSQVYLYTFDNSSNNSNDNSNNNGSDISNNKGSDKANKKGADNTGEKPVIPSINSLNNTNKLNIKNEDEHKRSKNSNKSISLHGRKTNGGRGSKKVEAPAEIPSVSLGKKDSGQKENANSTPSVAELAEAPTLNEIKIYFVENKWPLLEAEKFFNHYESNGWLVAGKTPMKNWKASSANWMINSKNFGTGKSPLSLGEGKGVRPGKLQTSNDKNYADPL
ncbi:MAG: transcriptional regulator [Bacteroidia bacterium]|nr:transcriptional regulator [Bacteroidia bacterium]